MISVKYVQDTREFVNVVVAVVVVDVGTARIEEEQQKKVMYFFLPGLIQVGIFKDARVIFIYKRN